MKLVASSCCRCSPSRRPQQPTIRTTAGTWRKPGARSHREAPATDRHVRRARPMSKRCLDRRGLGASRPGDRRQSHALRRVLDLDPAARRQQEGTPRPQDDVIRALGVHPVAEFTVGEVTGWANWVLASPTDDRTWFTAGVEFRKAMAAAGYSGPDETWLLNELDRSTMRDAPRGVFPADHAWPAFPRAAMVEVLRVSITARSDGAHARPRRDRHPPSAPEHAGRCGPAVQVGGRAWLTDNAFWAGISPAVRWLGVESTRTSGTGASRARHAESVAERSRSTRSTCSSSFATRRETSPPRASCSSARTCLSRTRAILPRLRREPARSCRRSEAPTS